MSFPCTSCGACCRRVGRDLEAMRSYGFPFKVKPDGSCEKLVGKLCSVYDARPDCCRVDYFPATPEYYEQTADLCNRFQEEDGMPISYRVDKEKAREQFNGEKVSGG